MKGHYVMPAIEPWCKEKRYEVTLLKELPGGRVLLEDDEMARRGVSYWIDTDKGNFLPIQTP